MERKVRIACLVGVFALIGCLSLTSCIVGSLGRKRVKQDFFKLTDIQNLQRPPFRTDGYYATPADSFEQKMLFFNDRVFVGYATIARGVTEDSLRANFSRCIRKWKSGKEEHWGYCWGVYKMKGDTVKVAVYGNYSKRTPTDFGIFAFKILNDTTMQRLEMRGDEPVAYPQLPSENRRWHPTGKVFHFFQAKGLPTSDGWLKKKVYVLKH